LEGKHRGVAFMHECRALLISGDAIAGHHRLALPVKNADPSVGEDSVVQAAA
jgi:hypothetical protein